MMMMLMLMMLQLVSKGCPKDIKQSGGGNQLLAKTKGGKTTEWQCVDVYIGLFTFLCVYICFSSICYNVMLVVV